MQWDGDESPTDETQSDLAVDDTDPAGFGYVLRWLILNPAAHDSGGWARSGPLHDLYKTVGVEIQSRHWRNQTTDADRAALIVAVAEVSR